MRNLLAFLAAAVLAFLAVGWYLDWYAIRPAASDLGRRSYTIDIDGKKIGRDVVKYGQKVQQLLDQDTAPQPASNKAVPARTSSFDLSEEAEANK